MSKLLTKFLAAIQRIIIPVLI